MKRGVLLTGQSKAAPCVLHLHSSRVVVQVGKLGCAKRILVPHTPPQVSPLVRENLKHMTMHAYMCHTRTRSQPPCPTLVRPRIAQGPGMTSVARIPKPDTHMFSPGVNTRGLEPATHHCTHPHQHTHTQPHTPTPTHIHTHTRTHAHTPHTHTNTHPTPTHIHNPPTHTHTHTRTRTHQSRLRHVATGVQECRGDVHVVALCEAHSRTRHEGAVRERRVRRVDLDVHARHLVGQQVTCQGQFQREN